MDGDRHGSAEGLAQSIPLKGKEDNLDIIDNDDWTNKEQKDVLAMTTFSHHTLSTDPWDKDGGCKAHEVQTR